MTVDAIGQMIGTATERARAATLHLIVHTDINEQHVRIDYVGACYGFALVSATGITIATSEHPLPLCRYAWANGALAIKHCYDLRLAELSK